MTSVRISHNIEVAHRLWSLDGNKCQNIHGHSMRVDLTIPADFIGPKGIAVIRGKELEFGALKRQFREHLDTVYDHHLLLNENDPWAGVFDLHDPLKDDPVDGHKLPGLITFEGDPSTENIAKWIAEWAAATFDTDVNVDVQETHVNAASVSAGRRRF